MTKDPITVLRDENALNDAAWKFIESAPRDGIPTVLWNNLKSTLWPAIQCYVSSTAPAAIQPAGMPTEQEPKYGIRDNRLFNRASGEFIPADEPVFIFRARDRHAIYALAQYKGHGLKEKHAAAVGERIKDFRAFMHTFPQRMKEPDTASTVSAPVPEAKAEQSLQALADQAQELGLYAAPAVKHEASEFPPPAPKLPRHPFPIDTPEFRERIQRLLCHRSINSNRGMKAYRALCTEIDIRVSKAARGEALD